MKVLAIAHRAANSLEALREATELGADVVEADVHALSGRLEIRHSKSLSPLPLLWERPGPVPPPGSGARQRRVEWIRAGGPQLELRELMAVLDPRSTLLLDLKGAGGVGARSFAELARAAREQPVIVCGRWWPSVDAFAGASWARPVLSARNRAELQRIRLRVRGTRRPYGVSLHRSLLTAPLVRELRARVELVMTWPVNSADALDEVLARGVTGVITDEAAVLRAVLDRP